jgi:phage shock protein C
MGPEFTQPPASPAPPPYPPYAPPPPRPRRLVRSSQERMWAGVAGGMAEYFDLDPALVRLLWVAAAVVSGGLAIPIYILAWIILPRDDRPPADGPNAWRDWSQEFHAETQRMADEARRVADDMRDAHRGWRSPGSGEPTGVEAQREPASAKGAPASYSSSQPEQAWWQSERYVERHRNHGRHPRSTGVVLVVLGMLLLAANAGIFSWIEWKTVWPLIFIGLGVILLARQSGWNR